jgi:hypothetical protein
MASARLVDWVVRARGRLLLAALACMVAAPFGVRPAWADCMPSPEVCNGVDDDCDGIIDNGFTFFGRNPSTNPVTVGNLPLGTPCGVGLGVCANDTGTVVCSQDGTAAVCSVDPLPAGTEGPFPDSTCYDFKDNNCDGLADFADPNCTTAEICDGFDNDNNGLIDDGLGLGDSCTVGTGVCQKTGVIVCDLGGGTKCSVTAGTGSPENTPGAGKCVDGLDNDCDGLVDLADPGCQTAEKCDGKDNDGDGLIDEDFPTLGQACSTGVGACHADGVRVCSADGTGTVCNAVAGLGSPEGPTGPSCSDGIDNDCDGVTDAADAGCGSAKLEVQCALPYINGKPGGDCTGRHTVKIKVLNGTSSTNVSAQIMGLDFDGNVMASFDVVEGDQLHLTSRIQPKDYKFNQSGRFVDIFAPNALLRVTADDGQKKVTAYCSPFPYVDVFKPANTVVPASGDNVTPVEVAIPLVLPKSIHILVDGVDILAQLGVNPNSAFPNTLASAINGTVNIGGQAVQIIDLVVQAAGDTKTFSSNSVTFSMSGLGCGGHKVVISGTRVNLPKVTSPDCNIDDLNDNGVSMTFSVDIFTPTPGQVTAGGATHVTGKVCHGQHIADVNVNGFVVPTTGQMTTGGGATTAATVMLPIDVMVPETDLRQELNSGVPSVGTFDAGSNRLTATAHDDDANATYKSLFFAVGPVQAPPPAALALPVAQAIASNVVALAGPPGSVDPAFTLALNGNALNTFFAENCKAVQTTVAQAVRTAIEQFTITKPIDALCDPNVTTTAIASTIMVDPAQLTCSVSPQQDKIVVTMNIPDISFTAHSGGYCEDTFLGVCTQSLTVDIDTPISITGMKVTFEVTEDNIRDKSPITPFFDPGILTKGTPDNDSDVGCIVGFLLDVFDVIAEIFTFGAYDPGPAAEAPVVTTDLEEKLGLIKGDPFTLDLLRYDSKDLPAFMTKIDYGFSDVSIDTNGMTVSVFGSFAPTMLDPEAAQVPGTPISNAPVPTPPVAGADEATIAISDDVFNQLFDGMTKTGKLKTLFNVSKPLTQLMPTPCSMIPTLDGQGACEGIKAAGNGSGLIAATNYCLGLFPSGSPDTLQPARQKCILIKLLLEGKQITANTPVIIRGRVDNAPKLQLDDDPSTLNRVESVLRLSQVSLALIADRDSNGFSGTLESLKGCFDQNAATIGDCFFLEGCANLNVFVTMALGSEDGKPSITTDLTSIDKDFSFGTLCGGGSGAGTDEEVVKQAAESQTSDIIANAVGNNTPPLAANGITFGDVVQFVNPRLVAIENNGDTDFQDYLAITGTLAPK